ncbi:ornithine decarboxylase [Nadsonia fulvescens var. elongata DSM 6958]|uniref:ornithine decarboxylase n=1 Tax=Nadsonia fulvescens var. elongata DSM 6958 TaxID=857566 RepID=A0A1E3PS77_9ASCO|nr:ornithine decarboxylase [Nadsonia fulvescens var. elongata DSM 6958]
MAPFVPGNEVELSSYQNEFSPTSSLPDSSPRSKSQDSISKALRARIESIDLESCDPGEEDTFYVADLGLIYQRFMTWKRLLPRVEPFYATKCNNDKRVLQLLAQLGAGFDCASVSEINSVLNLDQCVVSPERIIYAHPCKTASSLRYASKLNVLKMTFDNADELYKCAKHAPNAELFLRITTDDSKAQCQLSVKYGAPLDTTGDLLTLAQQLNLNVVGVSFHVGSGASDPTDFVKAVEDARHVFDQAASLGMAPLSTLDIGGGFTHETFAETASLLNGLLDECFPRDQVRIISEPGRYFVSSAFVLASHVIAKRTIDETHAMIYLNDGAYGNMNCIIFDHQKPIPRMLTHNGKFMYNAPSNTTNTGSNEEKYTLSVWGPTCDGIDCIAERTMLTVSPNAGDWMYFEEFGAYTLSASTTFNGFNENCQIVYVCSEKEAAKLLPF